MALSRRTALDAPADLLDPAETAFVDGIRKYGWYSTTVFQGENTPAFSYTTGFWLRLGFPEIIVFSLGQKTSHQVFWDIFRDVERQEPPPVGVRTEAIFAGAEAVLTPVAKVHYANHLGWSRWFYGSDEFPCLQLIWPNEHGAFPWLDDTEQDLSSRQTDLSEAGWGAMFGN